MKLDYGELITDVYHVNDKEVKVSIPLTVPKLNDDIAEYIYKNFPRDEQFKELAKYTKKDYYQKEVKAVGIWMSGGADSSLLSYCLAKLIKDHNLDIKLQPLSVRRGRPNNPIYAGNVIDFIEEDLDVKLNDHIVYYPPKDDSHYMEIEIFKEKDGEHFERDLFQVQYSGITCNPPADDPSIPINKERTRDEDAERPLLTLNGFRFYMNPFFCINKRGLRQIYDQLGLVDKLFPLTFSCEGSVEDTKTHTQHCGKCWWCQERYWAFGRYV